MSEYNFGDSEVMMVAYAMMAIAFLVEPALAGRGSGTRESGGARS